MSFADFTVPQYQRDDSYSAPLAGRGRPMRTEPAMFRRAPVPGSQPPTRTWAARMFRIFSHARVRRPGWYSEAGNGGACEGAPGCLPA